MLDPNFTIVEKARAGAYDYSFPQRPYPECRSRIRQRGHGHKKEVASHLLHRCGRSGSGLPDVSGGPHAFGRKRGCAHFAGTSLCPAAGVPGREGKRTSYALAGMLVLAAGYLCYAQFWPFPADIDAGSLAGGQKNAYTLLGGAAWSDSRLYPG